MSAEQWIKRDWSDVMERLSRAEIELRVMASNARIIDDRVRLTAKAQGVALAIDYLRGYGHHGGAA